MATSANRNSIEEAYEDVRNDNTDTTWVCLKYDSSNLVVDGTGSDFEELTSKFGDEERAYAYLRMTTGDEMSKRSKFVLLCWCGPGVGALKKAKLSTDKANVKQIFRSFAVEMFLEERSDCSESKIKEAVMKAGGANYGTGQ